MQVKQYTLLKINKKNPHTLVRNNSNKIYFNLTVYTLDIGNWEYDNIAGKFCDRVTIHKHMYGW